MEAVCAAIVFAFVSSFFLFWGGEDAPPLPLVFDHSQPSRRLNTPRSNPAFVIAGGSL